MNPSTELQVVAKAGNVVTVKKGDCNINGAIGIQDEDLDITLENASSQPRIDRIIVRLDDNVSARNISIQVLTGTPSASPTPPPLTRITSVYDLCIASIYRPANATAIKQSDITDTRAEISLCGIVCGTIKEADSQTIYLQIQTHLKEFKEDEEAQFVVWSDGRKLTFDEWFETIKGKLGEDIAGSLQMQIDELESKLPVELEKKENVFDKNSAFNKNFGNVVGTVCEGNDPRLSDPRNPTSHTHDERYYTEAEVNNLLSGKSSTSHTHDDRYYTEGEADARYKFKGDFVIVTGSVTLSSGSGSTKVGFPSGLNKDNCVIVSFMSRNNAQASNYGYAEGYTTSSMGNVVGGRERQVYFDDGININYNSGTASSTNATFSFKLVLMKV
ncbi:hypothetical protein ACWG0P_07065 [Amedibacillus sp. YH-ame6]